MTIITPTFMDTIKTNGAAGAPHLRHPADPGGDGPPSRQTNETCRAAGPPLAEISQGNEAVHPFKVALIGTAPSSRMLAPYGDPSWKIWGCSPGNMNALPRVDVWFELHSNLLWPEHESYGRPYIEWLKAQTFPVYMQDQSLVPNATPFPMYDMVREFGRDFFTSSFAWMMALAIKMGASEIALYGIDMASRDEYILQRPGFYFFRNMAEMRGIKVSAPHESDIMQSPPLYAYSDSTPMGRKISARESEVNGRINGMIPQRDQLNHSITYLQGAKEDIDYFKSIWSGATDEIVLLKAEREHLRQRVAQLEKPAPPVGAPIQITAGTLPAKPKRKYTKRAVSPPPEAESPIMEARDG